jgi:hypothetical protein
VPVRSAGAPYQLVGRSNKSLITFTEKLPNARSSDEPHASAALGELLRSPEVKPAPDTRVVEATAIIPNNAPQLTSSLEPASPAEVEMNAQQTTAPVSSRSVPSGLTAKGAAMRRLPPPEAQTGRDKAGALELRGLPQQTGAPVSQASSPPPRSDRTRPNISRKQKPESDPAMRTAARQEEAVQGAQTTAQAGAESERTRLLGIPLPTGTEVKQCLLQFRC